MSMQAGPEKNIDVLASIIILTYNSRAHLAECLPSMLRQTYPNYEIIVVDNASSDDTSSFIKSNYPDIKFIDTGSNFGYAKGNNVGFEHALGEFIVIVNPDVVVEREWLSELIAPLKANPRVALTTSKILIYQNEKVINTCGNLAHFTGFDFCRGLNESSTRYILPENVSSISGCSFAIRRQVFERLTGFDPDFFMYLEDVDLSWRARLMGYDIMYVPTSIIYHKFSLSIAPWKEFYLERNRYMILLKNYTLKTLILISPALLVTEIITVSHAILHGIPFIRNKIGAYWWIFTHLNMISEKRASIQKSRIASDRNLVGSLEWKVPFEQVIGNKLVSNIAGLVFNSFYRAYYGMMKKVV